MLLLALLLSWMETRTPDVSRHAPSLALPLFSFLEQSPFVPLAQVLFSAAHPPDSGHSGTYEHNT